MDAGPADAGPANAGPADACVGETEAQLREVHCTVNACDPRSVRDACGALRTVDCGSTCASPPPATCANGSTRRSYGSAGTCVSGVCEYAPILVACGTPSWPNGVATAAGTCSGDGVCAAGATSACTFGCAGTVCAGDPCASVTCSVPPSPSCADGNTRRIYASTGTCRAVGGTATCEFASTDTPCPAATCINGVATAASNCLSGTCRAPAQTACAWGCLGTVCAPSPCVGVSCTTPPATTCANATTRRTYASTGTCSAASGTPQCSYSATDTACAAASCRNGVATAAGTCVNGTCQTGAQTVCTFGCLGTVCAPDPCAGVTCTTPPATTCADATTIRRYVSPGRCTTTTGQPACSYTPMDTVCSDGLVCGSGGTCVQSMNGAAPSTPTNLMATTLNSTQISLTWGASTARDPARLSGYKVERCLGSSCTDFVQLSATSTSTTATSSYLTTGTAYSYRVRAYDNLGNHSNYSNVASATTGGTTYTNANNYEIPSYNVVESPITVIGRTGYAPATTRVDVSIVYPDIRGLNVQLINPSGTFYWLHNNGVSATNNLVRFYQVNLSSSAMSGRWRLRAWGSSRSSYCYIDSWSITF